MCKSQFPLYPSGPSFKEGASTFHFGRRRVDELNTSDFSFKAEILVG